MGDHEFFGGFGDIAQFRRARAKNNGAAKSANGRGIDAFLKIIMKKNKEMAVSPNNGGVRWPGVFASLELENVALDTCVVWSGCARNYARLSAGDVSDLSVSVGKFGILNPLIGRRNMDGRVEIVSGSRRFFCAKLLGMSHAPIFVGDITDSEAEKLAVVLNNHRRLDADDRARFVDRLQEDGEDPFNDAELLARHF